MINIRPPLARCILSFLASPDSRLRGNDEPRFRGMTFDDMNHLLLHDTRRIFGLARHVPYKNTHPCRHSGGCRNLDPKSKEVVRKKAA